MKVFGMPATWPEANVAQGPGLVAVAEAACRVGRIVAGGAAIDQQPAQRHDEGLHFQPGDQEPLNRPQHKSAQQHSQQRQGPGNLIRRQKIDEYDAEQREH
ncbi:hypothetical protein ACVWYH_006901 [Bradyrhizobium sp. GM24.11]